MSERYLIWSIEHRGWWKASRHGYTTRTDLAGRFNQDEALAIVAQANRYIRDKVEEFMVPAPSHDQIRLDLDYPDR